MQLLNTKPSEDYSSVPFELFHSPKIYEQERARIFSDRAWSYLCLEVEVQAAGAFVTTEVGDIPVLVNRTENGEILAFENRCMHRGTKLRRENRGNDVSHTCVYHQWCYSLDGRLASVPFARGFNGKGGLPADFDKSQVRLRTMRVSVVHGVVWGTFKHDNVHIEEYLGPKIMETLGNLFFKPIEILGYQRQRIMGNWKLYNENLRDPNHGSLLHMFHATFGLARATQVGGARMDEKHRHNISYVTMGTDDASANKEAYKDTKKVFQGDFRLNDLSILRYIKELPNPESLIIASVFPNVIFQQITNSLCTRQIKLRGVDEFELYWTYYGFQDDSEEMKQHRRVQANLVGPAGLVSMEDGEAVQLVHDQTRSNPGASSQIIIGGRGEITDQDYTVTEVPIRGFWSHYFDVMDLD
jgi:anthranilate 1,2-dioxygenase large subunit